MNDNSLLFGKNRGIIIESDNLIALQALERNYTGKIDVMPIDPPYNTAIDYIEYKDSEFDNGWISFMRPRLISAYKLLSPAGVMFIHIDENEICNLTALCKEIFGEGNVNILVWMKVNEHFDANRVEKPTINIRRTHEFVVLCYKNKTETHFNKIKQSIFENGKIIEKEQYLETVVDGFGTTASAKDELLELFGSRETFSTPKPMRLIKEFVRAASKKDSIVLDFFAGSGTAGHAVMDLNKEDNGKRKFILITNNESNICRDVTIPRIQKAIVKNGYADKFKAVFTNDRTPIGMTVDVSIDRPIGTEHPKRKGVIYKINYGGIDGFLAGDDEEQDVYILGVNEPIKKFTGKVIAVIKRFDDVENKWVATLDDKTYSKTEIEEAVRFQEEYYKTEIIM